MGFYSTFTTEDCRITWPQWFREKYSKSIWFKDDHTGTIASKREGKTYAVFSDLPADIQRAIDWNDFQLKKFVMVYLHECGGITRCQIEKDAIKWSEPESWQQTNDVEHDYCYGCSDI